MDNNAARLLRCESNYMPSSITYLIIGHQVCIFLLLMPIIAAPLEAMAVLGTCCSLISREKNFVHVYGCHQVLSSWASQYTTWPKEAKGKTCRSSLVIISSQKLTRGSNALLSHVVGLFASCFARLRGRPSPGTGWQAVATEGDEHLEMSEQWRQICRTLSWWPAVRTFGNDIRYIHVC